MHRSATRRLKTKWRIGLFLLMVLVGGVVGYLVYNREDRGASEEVEPPAGIPARQDRP